MRGTHVLSSAERGDRQDSDTNPANEGHSRPVERRARDPSVQQKSNREGRSHPFERRVMKSSLVRTLYCEEVSKSGGQARGRLSDDFDRGVLSVSGVRGSCSCP
jgi:hypothetical protein